MAVMDPNLFPWMTTPSVPYMQGTPGAGQIPQQPAQAPVAPTPGAGIFGTIGQMIGARPPVSGPGSQPYQGAAPDFASAGGAGLYPFIGQDQNMRSPNMGFGPNPLTTPPTPPEDTSTPPNATSTVGQGSPLGGGASTGNKLLDTLRGTKAPAAPTPQTVRTPAAPQLAPIQGNNLIPMLTSLGIGPQEFMRMMGTGGLGRR